MALGGMRADLAGTIAVSAAAVSDAGEDAKGAGGLAPGAQGPSCRDFLPMCF